MTKEELERAKAVVTDAMKNAPTIRTPAQPCPACGHTLDAHCQATGSDNGRPEEGDFTVCAKCGEVLRYAHALKLRVLEPEDVAEMDAQTKNVLAVVKTIVRKLR